MIEPLLPPNYTRLSLKQVQQLSPAALAYLGDAVYELWARLYFLLPPRRLSSYHQHVVTYVRAETQADFVRSLEAFLSPEELDIVRRGRNAASRSSKRRDLATYQQATGFEALVGYLYLVNPERLLEVLHHLVILPEPSDSSSEI